MLPPASTFLFSGAGEHFPAQMSSEEHRGWSSDAIPASQTRAEWRSIQRSSGRSRHPGSVKEREYREDDESFGCRAGGAVRAVHRGEDGEAEAPLSRHSRCRRQNGKEKTARRTPPGVADTDVYDHDDLIPSGALQQAPEQEHRQTRRSFVA